MEVGVFTDASGEQSCVSCWDLKTGTSLKAFKNGSCSRNGLAISRNEFVFAGQHDKHLIHLYGMKREQLLKKVVCPEKVSALAVSPDGHYAVVACLEKIYIWQVATGNLMCVLSKHYQRINGVKFTRDGRFFVTHGKDSLLLVWNFNIALQDGGRSMHGESTTPPVHIISKHSMSIEDVHMGSSASRCYIITCSIDQTCKMFDLASGVLLHTFIFDAMCTSVAMDTMEKRLFVGTSNGEISLVNCFEENSGRNQHVDKTETFSGHKKSVGCLCVTHDALQLLSGSSDCTVKLWHIQSKQCVRTFEFKGEVTNILLVPFTWFRHEACCQLGKENFKRTCYEPNHGNLSKATYDISDTVPVFLKRIENDDERQQKDKDLLQAVLNEHTTSTEKNKSDSVWCESNKTMTRSQLLHKISVLETITQKFYGVPTDGAMFNTDDPMQLGEK